MVYIPFPQTALNDDADLTAWRNKTNKQAGNWTSLKPFLAKQAQVLDGIHTTPKCWYSELPQGDDFALDVEHFRPKNQASPLNKKQLKKVEKETGFVLRQDIAVGAYPWLEFDYRNYRLVTAKTNRGGAKHIFFPIAEGTQRLSQGQNAWQNPEYNYLLDPCDPLDASLLLVMPDGAITPRPPKTLPTDADFADISNSWRNEGFNYVRAVVTIQLYRLDDRTFTKGRKEVYDTVSRKMEDILLSFDPDHDVLRKRAIEEVFKMTLYSAPFSLAARCALEAYFPPANAPDPIKESLTNIARDILRKTYQVDTAQTISWNNA